MANSSDKKKTSGKFVETYSGRSGSSAALVSPAAKRKITKKGGEEFGTDRQISSAGSKYGTTSKSLGTEFTTVRSGKDSKKAYGSKGKFAAVSKPTAPNKKGK
jgi:hypothetical protein